VRRLIVNMFLTLDGVMQAPGQKDEDTDGGFEHGGWQMPYFDEIFGASLMEGFASTDALLLGRRTYEIFAAHWPLQPTDDPLAATMNAFDKHVVSTTLESADWMNSEILRGDIPEEVRGIKQQPGKDIRVIGSGRLVPMLLANDLVDRYDLMIHPLVLGTGKHLFGEGTPATRLSLVEHKASSTGVLILGYEPERPTQAA
jgi:dihydrofolate reductase